MYLVFDTETTGLPKNYNAPISDLANWPRLVQLAWQTYDEDGNLWETHNHIIRPIGFVISEESARIHRITQARALAEGEDLKEVLEIFADHIKRASHLVAHNISFDEKIMGAEFLRQEIPSILDDSSKICTMKSSVNFCALSNNRGGYKWPNLAELHFKLFAKNFDAAHDAVIDVSACARCFFELKSRGVLNL